MQATRGTAGGPGDDASGRACPCVEGTERHSGRFCPDEPIDGWVMAVWLVRAVDEREPSPASGPPFAGCGRAPLVGPHVERLGELGTTIGCATGPAWFCPDGPVTTAQTATFLTGAFGFETAPAPGFADTVGNFHAAGIDASAASGITGGCATVPLRYCPGEG